jgi:hypothetical protein
LRAFFVAAPLLLTGCATALDHRTESPLQGWHLVEPGPGNYRLRTQPLRGPACTAGSAATAWVLVPGIGGEPSTWSDTVARLEATQTGPVSLFRWSPWEPTDRLAERFAAGVFEWHACLPPQTAIRVLAHSAGGVVVSRAAPRLAALGREISIYTVASPLAGKDKAGPRAEKLKLESIATDLGKRLTYPQEAPGIEVVHLHTSALSDPVMRPSVRGHRPNDPHVGVPGASHVALPDSLGHVEAFDWFVERLVGEGGDALVW